MPSKVKTLAAFEKLDDKAFEGLSLTDYLQPLDEIDWFLYEHISCGWVAPSYDNGKFVQAGEAEDNVNGVFTYMTCANINGRYFYLGILPAFQHGS